MAYSNTTLKLFETLSRARPPLSLCEGMRVGRGFADVGYEEFLVISADRLVSLLTGTVSALDEMRREHLFEIPTIDQIIGEIHRAGYEIVDVACVDRRTWRASLRNLEGGTCVTEEARSVEECFLKLALTAYQVKLVPEERCLKTEMVNR